MQNKRVALYWSLQFAGWGIYFSIPATIMLLQGAKNIIVFLWLIIMLFHLAGSHLLHFAIKRNRWVDLPPLRLIGRLSFACPCLAILVELLLVPVPPLLGLDTPREQLLMSRYYAVTSFILYSLWSFIYVAFQYFFRYRDSEMKRLRLEASINEAELRALKAQVNPHFLFNCLNNLRALVAEDGEKAREMLLSLSELLRYSLDAARRDKVPLEQELRIVEGYLRLEKMHFEHRLTWRCDIPDEALPVMIPPMLLQQLVENAIKHGIAPNKTGGEILVWARKAPAGLELGVENTGRLSESRSKGFGIENVRERLRLLCGAGASFDLQNMGESRVAATARIPLPA